MSIFRRDPEPIQPKPAPPPPTPARPAAPGKGPTAEPTRIAVGSKVVGEISGDASLHIDGHVEGSIRLDKSVVVGAEGRVEGPIEAGSVHVGGKVTGNVYGRERVEVQAGGSLEGDVTSPRVVIDPGAAFFRGKIEMSDKAPRGGSVGTPSRGPASSPSPRSDAPAGQGSSATTTGSVATPSATTDGKPGLRGGGAEMSDDDRDPRSLSRKGRRG